MIDKLLSLTKSNEGFFTGLYKSKKFAIATIWTCAALIYPEHVSIWSGAGVAAVYILGQSIVEAFAMHASENGDEKKPEEKKA